MWGPSNDFHDEILAIQPECDMTFELYDGPPSLAGPLLAGTIGNGCDERNFVIPDNYRDVNLISKINSCLPKRSAIGTLLTEEDIKDENRETEIVAMIRRIGMGSSLNEGFDSTKSLPTLVSNKRYIAANIPIILDEDCFKLKPRKSNSSTPTRKSNSSTPTSESSFTQVKTISIDSDDGSGTDSTGGVPYKKLNDNSSSNSGDHKLNQTYTKLDGIGIANPIIECDGEVRYSLKKKADEVKKSECIRNGGIEQVLHQDSESSTSINYISLFREQNKFYTPKELYMIKQKHLS